ncbi:MAG: carboxypeptidase regulatory-like domain-containing protein [Holophagales bacterium]|jgi:tetratricopeptide (TPR) repeat protein|nr:carboxypeptidase regulatory-like domain-containing protein [Holophagales bacterium]
MKNLCYCAAVLIVSTSLAAQVTGRVFGKVTDTAGKVIPNVSVSLKQMDTNSVRNLKVNKKGEFIQAGLTPKEYELIISAEGYVGVNEIIKIPLNDFIERNITLKTPDEVIQESNPGASIASGKADEGNQAYTEAVKFYNDRNYVEAMPRFEATIDYYNQSLAEAKDGSLLEETKKFLTIAVDSLANCQYQVGKSDPSQRDELWQKAEPVLTNAFDAVPKDKPQDRARLASFLAEISRAKGDEDAVKKYEGIIEEIEGPKAENSYNVAVQLYNAGNLAEAIPHLKKAIEINPKFAETYYLLAICEYAGGDLKAAKTNLQKYIELDPKGKYADEVREMLDDPSIKNLK